MGTNGINNVYNSFYNIRSNVPYFMPKKDEQKQNNIFIDKPIASVRMSDCEPSKKKNLLQWGIGIGSLVATLTVGSLLFTRGGSSKTMSRLNKLISKLDDKVYSLGQTNKTVGTMQRVYSSCVNGIKKTLKFSKISANFTAIKDTICRKITDFSFTIGKKKYQPLKFIADGCERLSEKITMHTAKKLANSAINESDELSAAFTKYSDKILKANPNDVIEIGSKKVKVCELFKQKFNYQGKEITGQQLLQKISELSGQIKPQTDTLLNATSRTQRIDTVKGGLGHLQADVEEAIKHSKNLMNGYVTENLSLPSRSATTKTLTQNTRKITNSIEDMVSQMSGALAETRGQILTTDKNSIDITRQLSKKISQYAQLSGSEERLLRTKYGEEIVRLTNNLTTSINSGHYTLEVKNAILKNLSTISDVIETGSQKGTLQELQTLMRILHNGEGKTFSTYKNQIQKCAKGISKASNFEQEVYKRLAELKVGAAFTDYAFIAGGAALGAYQVVKQDDKDKMISASLTQGIPVFGSLGLCLYQTSKGMTGVLPLIIALAGGKILNIIGGSVSDKYLASAKSKREFINELTNLKIVQANNHPIASQNV